MTSEKTDIIITSNSPGELYSFVRPAVKAIAEKMPDARLILVITPCQFASGREIEVARSFKELYEIIFPEEFNAWIFKNKPPRGIVFSKKGIVLFLGGDLLHAVMLSKRLGYKAAAYTMDHVGWKKNFLAFFVPDEAMAKKALRKGIPKHKVKVTGDLMVDSVLASQRPEDFGLDTGKPIITFLPGSRTAHIKFLAPLFLKTAKELRSKMPDAQFIFGLSPFTNALKVAEAVAKEKADKAAKKYGLFGDLVIEDNRKYLAAGDGIKILLIEKAPFDAMNIADLIVTIPGTNTAEAAALGKPMLVAIPFNKPEVLLFEGLLGMIGSVPLLGKLIKQAAIHILNKTVKFAALPNRKAGKMIVPELRGVLTAEEIAEKACLMLRDKEALEAMEKELKAVMGPAGAAGKIAEELSHILM
ncbi:MAG: hypothetical protein NTZ10_01685 [Candidatus Saganbacteria bacterium]|nr:hypothetical protein [Candidatus Saganbacteria bacterium]